MTDHGAARSYGQALLDVVSSHPRDDGSLLTLARVRARAVGGGHVSLQGLGVEADLSEAVGGTLTLVRTLVTMVQEASGRSEHEIIDEVRQRFDLSCRA